MKTESKWKLAPEELITLDIETIVRYMRQRNYPVAAIFVKKLREHWQLYRDGKLTDTYL